MENNHGRQLGIEHARESFDLTETLIHLDPSAQQDTPRRGKVLVMGDDTRGFLATVRSLGRQGIEVHAAPFDFSAPALSSRFIAAVHDVPPWMGNGDAWLEAMHALLTTHSFDLVIPCDERNLLPLHLHQTAFIGLAKFAVPNSRAIDVLFDKHETRLLAAQVGVPIANGRLARPSDSAGAILAEFGAPVVVKPRRSYTIEGLAKRGRVHVTSDEAQLDQLLQEAEPGSLLLESCFDGDGLGLSVLAHDGRLLQAFEHRRVHERSGSSFYRVSAAPTPDLVQACAAIAAAIHFTGVAMFEFKRSATGAWIMLEVNARPWGSLPLPVAVGVDFPYRWYRLLVDGIETAPVPYQVGIFGRNLIPDFRSALADAESYKTPLRKAGAFVQRVAGIRRMLINAERHDVFVRDDPAPAYAEFADIVRSSVVRGRRLIPGMQRAGAARARATVVSVAARASKPHILFACQGNICRSPYAAAVLKEMAGDTVTVASAGMMPRPGRAVPDLFQAQAAAEGIDLTAHRSTWLDRRSAASASLIVLFDRVNQAAFAERFPNFEVSTILLGDLLGLGEIEDPVNGDKAVVASSYAQIRSGVSKLAVLLRTHIDHDPVRG